MVERLGCMKEEPRNIIVEFLDGRREVGRLDERKAIVKFRKNITFESINFSLEGQKERGEIND